jgi:hypothetical protein
MTSVAKVDPCCDRPSYVNTVKAFVCTLFVLRVRREGSPIQHLSGPGLAARVTDRG